MADEEAEQESGSLGGDLLEMQRLRERLVELETGLRESPEPAVQAATEYCKQLCQTLLEYAQKWKTSEDPLPLLEVYTVAIRSYVKARPYLTSECENVAFVLERLALSCIELLLCLPIDLPDNKWEEFQAFVQLAHKSLMENGSRELHILTTLTQEKGAWKNPVLCGILSQEQLDPDKVNDFLVFEGPILLDMRIKHLMKTKQITQATALAKLCSDHPEISAKGNFKQTYLVCLCSGSPNEKLMEEISEVDCKDALEMICNLESDGDEKSALILCAAFLSRQLQQGEMYCAWELTLFWSKLQQRVEPSIQVYLERCRQLSVLTKTVYHIFFLIKVINSEIDSAGLATCIELCVKALRLESSENADVKISICKTISCLLPDDLEVKRACQLSEFLLEPTVDAYYAVEMLYNQPDQKYDEENLPIPNSLRCELLLVLKTQWPFDPEFWDWKTLKRQCLALMGEEASIVSSIDELNDSEVYEKLEDCQEETKEASMNGLAGTFDEATSLLKDIGDEKQKKREIKKLRERGFISARFRNWQAYMQYCVLCDKEFLGHRIVRHAQKHYKDGIYSCPICAENFNSKENFVPHVTLHVKNSSKERLAAMKPLKRLGRPPKIATANENQKTDPVSKQEQRPIKKNSLYSTDFIVFNDNDGSDDENNDKDKPYIPEIVPVQKPLPVNEFTCPVSFCKKGFKYFKNLIAHAKGHKDNEEAKRFLEMQSKKVICQYCRRHFVSVTHLNDHLQMHCGSKPYICIQMKCKAGFNSYAELLTHRKEHQVFRAKCMFPKCGRVFSEAYLLYDHEAQHYNTFTCKVTSCGKVYRSQNELEKHVEDHSKQPEVVQQPEAVQQPESQTNQPDLRQPVNTNENTDGVAVKEELTFPPADNPSSFTEGENIVWNEVKAEPAGNESINASAIVLQQSDSLPNDAGLDKCPTGSVKAEVAIPASSIEVPAVNQKIRDNFVKRGKLAAAASRVETTKPETQQLCTLVDPCLPVFQERKEGDCLSQTHNIQNISVTSDTLKPEALESKSLERQVNIVNPFSVQNQAGYRNSVPISKLEIEGSMKASVNLYNLPLKTLESITFIPSQPNINSSLVPAASPAAPVRKYSCPVEGCTRTYNSSQSVGKHMKAAHPEEYVDFKMQRKNKKPRKSIGMQNVPNDGKIVYLVPTKVGNRSGAAVIAQNKPNLNPTGSSQVQHVSSALFPTHLENLANPMLPTVGSVINPSLSTPIKSEPESVLCSQMENLSGATLPSQLDDLAKKVMPLNIDGGSDPFLPLPAENGPMSLFPSTAENPPNSVFSQVESNTNNFSSQLEGNGSSAFTKEETVVQLFPSRLGNENNFIETSSRDLASEKVKKDRVRDLNGKERKPKHNKRAKWPAIIRDGKFICSRCFRVFTNPRSLGGHLSKRSYCKPLEGSEISAEALQANGQSLLASMILSSNSLNLQQPQESAFNPETCFKDPSFLQLLAAENRSTALLQTVFPRAGVTNFNTGGNEEGNQIMKQALETAGIPSTFDNTEVLPHVVPTSCITATTQINAAVLPNSTTSPLVQTACNPSTPLTDQNRTLNTKIAPLKVFRRLPVFTKGNAVPRKFEDDLWSDSFSDPVPATQNIAGDSSRVSVISSPKDPGSSNLNKKGTSVSKKKKKVTMPLLAPNTSPKVAVNSTVVGLLTKSTEGNVQMQGEDFQSNLLVSHGSQVVENLTQKLNNVDNQLLMTSIKENLKTDLEAHTTLPPLTVKNENGDSQMMAVNSCVQANLEKKISEDNVLQNFEKTLEMLKTALNKDILEVKSEIQDTVGASGKNSQVNNTQASLGDSAHSVKLTQFAMHVGNVTAAKSSSAQSEMSQKDDTQMLEIMERLQKLKLDEDPPIPVSQTVSQCPLTDTLAPGVPVVSTENKTLIQLSAEASNIQFSDKVNKPFVCQDPGCSYSAMTKDALFKHYGKIHQYTAEMILEIKKHQLKYAPFKCVVATCPKTFTRNSNLRAHCQLVHHFTTEEMVKLKIKRPYGRRSQNETVNTAPRPVEIKTLHPLTIGTKTAAPLVKEAQTKEVIEPVIVLEKLLPENIPERLEKPPQVISVLPEQHNAVSFGSTQAEAKLHKVRRYRKEKEDRKRRKPVPKSLEFPTRYSPYRPYRCVHQGCFAAFTIQQNLILHYQAVHKSDLPAFSAEVEEENEPGREERDEMETKPVVREFRCEVSDCSRIFQEVTSLIQHYVKLHGMTPEQIGNMKPAPEVGRFSCDQSQCKSSFTAYLNYVVHLEADHGIKIKPNKVEDDGVFRCDCEGCDRVYATRSNLLRHIFNKHNDRHKDHLIRPRRLTPDQENNSSKANQEKPLKSKQRVLKNRSGKECNRLSGKTQLKKNLNLDNKNSKEIQVEENQGYSLKRGKHVYSIKARNDALLECTSRFITQYPCMIKGCSSVVTSESNIIRHYKCHKLSKAFTSQHRNLLIVSKKLSVLPVKEDSCEQEETDKKSDVKEPEPSLIVSNNDSSTTTLPQKETEKGEKDEVDELTELFITKLINEDCSGAENQAKISSSVNNDLPETNSCPSEKQKINLKRANKEKNVSQSKRRKVEKPEEVPPADVSSMHREEETAVAIQTAEEQPAAFDWSSFKPMGFEASFLKFLEESAVKQKKTTERDCHSAGTKKGSHSNARKHNEKTSVASNNVTWSCSENETLIPFANPSQLPCGDNVKIVLDKTFVRIVLEKTFKDCTERVLRQLQEMKPVVTLRKTEGHWEDNPEVLAAEVTVKGPKEGESKY